MKSLTVLFVVAAGAVASAQGSSRADQYERNYGFQWGIGTLNGGRARTWEGGDLRAPTVEQGNKRQPGPARYEDVRVTMNAMLEPVLQEWLRGALDGEQPARDINLVMLKRDGTAAKSTLFQSSKITELVIPALSGDELDVEANVVLKFAPTSAQALAQTPAIAGPTVGVAPKSEVRVKAWTNQFALAIKGLDAKDVVKISSITVRIRQGSAPQISNIVLSIFEHPGAIAGWRAWFDSFVVQQNNGDAQEKSGTLELRDVAKVVLSIGLKGLGIVRMSSGFAAEGNAGTVILHEIELYCEGMTINAAGASTTTPTPPPSTSSGQPLPPEIGKAPLPPASKQPLPPETGKTPPVTDPAAGNAEDKGARDPEGCPRLPDSVRVEYSSSVTKLTNEERAEYVTKQLSEKVEGFYTEKMKEQGWELTSRTEAGDPKDVTYRLDIRWERAREKRVSRLTIGRAKDGQTRIWMWNTTDVR